MLLKYSDFLLESYHSSLYHILDLEKFEYVMKNNQIKSHTAGEGKISLTRDIMMNHYLGDNAQSIIKLEIDAEKLKQKYKVRPFSYKTRNAGYLDESEEQVQTDLIKPIFPYIKRIILIKSRIEHLLKSSSDRPSSYITSEGTRAGTICDIIKKIKDLAEEKGFYLYIQAGSKIEKDDKYIESLINYPLIDIEVKYVIMHRGYIKNKDLGYSDVLIDSEQNEIRKFFIGQKFDSVVGLSDKASLDKNVKSFYKDDQEFKPYILEFQRVENKWLLRDMEPL